MPSRFFSVCFLAALLLFPLMLSAGEIPDQLSRDLKPAAGVVIMPIEGEYLIDLDADRGVSTGDLVSVVEPGDNVIHPVSGKTLGKLERVIGILQVTRVKKGYSYARPLKKEGEIGRGDTVKRFVGVPAIFWDYTGQGESYFEELRGTLPDLDWHGYAAAQASRPPTPSAAAAPEGGMVFVYRSGSLSVHGGGFQTIRKYQWAASKPERSAVPTRPAASTAPPAPGAVQWQDGFLPSGGGPSYPGFRLVGELPGRTSMADFVREGGELLLAATDGSTISVFSVGEALELRAGGDVRAPGPIFSLHWWRPEPAGPLYLAVTGGVERNLGSPAGSLYLTSAIYVLRENTLVPVRDGITFILGSFDRDGDGNPETLLAQEFDRDKFFGRRVQEVRLSGAGVSFSAASFEIPSGFAVQGSSFADFTGDGRPETATVGRRSLRVLDGEKRLYQSSQQMGGSLSVMTYDLNPEAKDRLFNSVSFEVPPLPADMDGDGHPELLAVASEGSSFSAPGLGPSISKTWLAVFKYHQGTFVKGKLEGEFESPIQGLAVTEDEVLLVVSETGSLLKGAGSSRLLAIPRR